MVYKLGPTLERGESQILLYYLKKIIHYPCYGKTHGYTSFTSSMEHSSIIYMHIARN